MKPDINSIVNSVDPDQPDLHRFQCNMGTRNN